MHWYLRRHIKSLHHVKYRAFPSRVSNTREVVKLGVTFDVSIGVSSAKHLTERNSCDANWKIHNNLNRPEDFLNLFYKPYAAISKHKMRSILLFVLALVLNASAHSAPCREFTEGESCSFSGFRCCAAKDGVVFCGAGQIGIISCLPGRCGSDNTSLDVPVICSKTH